MNAGGETAEPGGIRLANGDAIVSDSRFQALTIRGSIGSRLLAFGAALPLQSPGQVPASPETGLLAEVVVTARKIEEDLQDVPLSVQVLTGEVLDATRATRLYELQFAIPGLVVTNLGMYGAGFSLRGIADQRAGGLSVAPHLDGVYLGSASAATARMFDIERIEVLKGPQGTLYGRNATGGSINIITRAPQSAPAAELEIAQNTFDTTRAEGYLNLPFSRAAVRLAFIACGGDGYIRNSVDDRRFAEEDYEGLRGSLRIDPNDALRIDVVAQHIRDDGGSGDLWSPRPDYLANPEDIRLTTVRLDDPYLISDVDNVSVNLVYRLRYATLRSITGYVRSEMDGVDDCAGLPVLRGCMRSVHPDAFEQWSQELQLIIPRRGNLAAILGAYYSAADARTVAFQLLPLVNTRPLSNNRSTSSEFAAALYGQADLDLADRWRLTAGARLSQEGRRVTTIGTGVQDSPALRVGKVESDDLSWLLTIDHSVRTDVMAYASVSTGYKSGGIVASTIIDGAPDSYGPEHLTAYEVGTKSRWQHGRLTVNAAAFHYDYRDLQVNTAAFVGDRVIFGVDNAARARLSGVDAAIDYRISDRWSISGGVVWLPVRKFVEYRNEVTGDRLSGNELVQAPEWSSTAAVAWRHTLRGRGAVSVRLEYNFRSASFYTPENDAKFAQGSFGLLNAHFRFEAANQRWYAFASGRNLTDEDYFNQVFLQSSPGYPDTYEIGAGIRF